MSPEANSVLSRVYDPTTNALRVSGAGAELGYAERLTNDTTTNVAVDDASLAANKISGLAITVVGTGRPVLIEYYTAGAYHSVANTNADAVIIVNNSSTNGQWGQGQSGITTDGPSLYVPRRLVLTNGVSYTFEVAKVSGAAGTSTFKGNALFPMYLAVTAK